MRLIIDTDPGIGSLGTDPEDGLAILYALGTHDVTVEGVTVVHGNVPINHGWRNVIHLLELAGRSDVPVHAGAALPRRPDRRAVQTAWLEQRDALTSIVPAIDPPDSDAAAYLVETVMAAPGEITLVAIGPLTNVADALEREPRVASALAGLVVMAGTVAVPGNITPAAEFNVWMDPEAASIVFGSGAPVAMIGLDVCHRTRFDRDMADAARARGTDLAAFVADSSTPWIEIMAATDDGEALHLYDSLAVATAIERDICRFRRTLVEVETGTGPAQGMTVTHTNEVLRELLVGRGPNADVAVDVDVDHFATRFSERVLDRL